ncbi:MAG: hypothetical protein CMK79_13035, partial [Pseudomonadales bacterium]|nr:hypothetical protein [Pseudomonadales bacterium]
MFAVVLFLSGAFVTAETDDLSTIGKVSEASEETQTPAAVSQPPVSSRVARRELQALMDGGVSQGTPIRQGVGVGHPVASGQPVSSVAAS